MLATVWARLNAGGQPPATAQGGAVAVLEEGCRLGMGGWGVVFFFFSGGGGGGGGGGRAKRIRRPSWPAAGGIGAGARAGCGFRIEDSDPQGAAAFLGEGTFHVKRSTIFRSPCPRRACGQGRNGFAGTGKNSTIESRRQQQERREVPKFSGNRQDSARRGAGTQFRRPSRMIR